MTQSRASLLSGFDQFLAAGGFRSYLAGLTLSAAGGTGTFGIAAGVAMDSTNAQLMALTSAFTKTTGAFVAGSGNGGLDTSTIAASSWYHVFQIMNVTTGAVDVCFSGTSTPASGPTAMPSGFTLFRRIGSMKTDGSSNWIKFSQNEDEFLWDVPVNDVLSTNPGTAAVLRTLTVPPGVKVAAVITAIGSTSSTNADGRFYLSSPDTSDQASGTSTANAGFLANTTGTWASTCGLTRIRTNTSAQVRTRNQASDAGTTVVLNTYGWIDTRGRLN